MTDALQLPFQITVDSVIPTGWPGARVLTVNSATPSVATGERFYSANTLPTVIQGFTGGGDGKRVSIYVSDSNTSFRNTGTLKTVSTADIVAPLGSTISFLNVAGVWYQQTQLLTLNVEPSNAEVTAWVAAVVAAGGTVSSTTQAAATLLMNDLTSASLRSKILRLNLRCGSNLAAALVPIIKDAGSATDTNHNFVSGDFTEATGLAAGASNTTKYLDTGLIPSATAISLTGASLGMYVANSYAGGNLVNIGAFDGTNSFEVQSFVSACVLFDSFDTGTGRAEKDSSILDSLGFSSGSRVANNDSRVFRNGRQISTPDTNVIATAPPTRSLYVFALNAAAGVTAFSPATSIGDFVGLGLTVADMVNLNDILYTFNRALGRVT